MPDSERAGLDDIASLGGLMPHGTSPGLGTWTISAVSRNSVQFAHFIPSSARSFLVPLKKVRSCW